VDGIVVLRTSTVPLAVTAFAPNGLSARLGATYVNRKGVLQIFPGLDRFAEGTEVWTGDFSINYRLPQRHGQISFGVSNISDKRYRIIDTNDASLPMPPERVFFGRLSITI